MLAACASPVRSGRAQLALTKVLANLNFDPVSLYTVLYHKATFLIFSNL